MLSKRKHILLIIITTLQVIKKLSSAVVSLCVIDNCTLQECLSPFFNTSEMVNIQVKRFKIKQVSICPQPPHHISSEGPRTHAVLTISVEFDEHIQVLNYFNGLQI